MNNESNNNEKRGAKGLIDKVSDMTNDYISDEKNQEKMKKTGKTALKIFGGGIVAYIIIGIIVFIIAVVIIINIFGKVGNGFDSINDAKNSIMSDSEKTKNDVNSIINDTRNSINTSEFNSSFERMTGSQSYDNVVSLLEDTISTINKNNDHSITVVYGNIVASNTSDIRSLKNGLATDKDYEIYLGYDDAGYVNKIEVYEK